MIKAGLGENPMTIGDSKRCFFVAVSRFSLSCRVWIGSVWISRNLGITRPRAICSGHANNNQFCCQFCCVSFWDQFSMTSMFQGWKHPPQSGLPDAIAMWSGSTTRAETVANQTGPKIHIELIGYIFIRLDAGSVKLCTCSKSKMYLVMQLCLMDFSLQINLQPKESQYKESYVSLTPS